MRCPADRTGGYSGLFTFAFDYIQALRVRAPMKRAVRALFEKCDVVAAPTRASVAYPVGKKFREAYPDVRGGPPFIPAGNLCGLPAACVPNGFGEAGLPTSVSFLGPALGERTLLDLAAVFQKETDWHRQRPPVG